MDPGPSLGSRIIGAIRLTHPFPSVLDGLVVGGVAALGGADAPAIVRLGVAMTALQLGIGALNDLVDVPRDAGRKPGKPIPAGLVTTRAAGRIAIGAFGLGILLAVPGGVILLALAAVVVAIGVSYDLWFKGTAWSWLPFAIGIPLLPVFGWVGATGALSPMFVVLVPVAVAGGAALAIGNALVDVDRDRAAGGTSVVIAVGEGPARAIAIGLLVSIAIAASGAVAWLGRGGPTVVAIGALGAVPALAAAMAGPIDPGRREVAWRAEAIGLGVLAIAWIRAVIG